MWASCCIAEVGMDSESQMQLLFAELKRIEGQQHQLKTAVAQNRVLIVHPPKGFNTESMEDEYAEEKVVKPDPDKFIPSGIIQYHNNCNNSSNKSDNNGNNNDNKQ